MNFSIKSLGKPILKSILTAGIYAGVITLLPGIELNPTVASGFGGLIFIIELLRAFVSTESMDRTLLLRTKSTAKAILIIVIFFGIGLSASIVESRLSLFQPPGRTEERPIMETVNEAVDKEVNEVWRALAETRVLKSIKNGDFSDESQHWDREGAFWIGKWPKFHSPRGYAAGGVSTKGNHITNSAGSISQKIMILPNVSSAKLSFWYSITSGEPSNSTDDFLTVRLKSMDGEILDTLTTLYSKDETSKDNYKKITVDVTPYAGRKLELVFQAVNDDEKHTVFRIDDVKLTKSWNKTEI
ncbi:choice-of-anchor J domain-containing protein [Candidatus Bipolaricaulota bacterium]|nr:choice-of-anchor J domain-containing protein [Candidatus Bipolaricaulota bacterium]